MRLGIISCYPVWKVTSQVESLTIDVDRDHGGEFEQIESFILNVIKKHDEEEKMEKWMIAKAFIREAIVTPEDLRMFALKERLIASGLRDRVFRTRSCNRVSHYSRRHRPRFWLFVLRLSSP